MAFTRDVNCLTPIMTSDTAPNGIASSNPQGFGASSAFYAFNGNASNYWGVNSTSAELTYEFTAPKVSTYYNIWNAGYASQCPKNWEYRGWNGTSWVVLDTQVDQAWADTLSGKKYTITNTTAYLKYQLNITAISSGTSMSISEFEICGSSTPKGRPHTI